MPIPNFVTVSMTPRARKALEEIIVAMTIEHKQRLTISDAVIKAAQKITREAAQESALTASGR
jgi:hypothetical protein